MSKHVFLVLTALLFTAGAAEAQFTGGGMSGGGMGGGAMGGGGGHGGGGRRQQAPPEPPAESAPPEHPKPGRETAPDKAQITGVIIAIDTANGRVTIRYDEVDALNWPAGTTPFTVEKPSLLSGLAVGQKVHFHVQSQQVSSIEPIGPSASPGRQ